MDEILDAERRDALVQEFASVANMNLLTNMDALLIIQVLEQACNRAQVDIEEGILTALIKGEDPEGEDPCEK